MHAFVSCNSRNESFLSSICKHFCFVVMQVIWTACLRWKDLQLTWWCFYWMPTKTWLHPLSREMRKEWAAVSIFSWCGHLVCSYEITVLGTIRYAWLNYHHHVACPSMSITFLTSWYLLDSNSGGHPFPILPFLPLHFPFSPSLQSFSFLPFASYLRQSSNRVWRIYMPECQTVPHLALGVVLDLFLLPNCLYSPLSTVEYKFCSERWHGSVGGMDQWLERQSVAGGLSLIYSWTTVDVWPLCG